MTIGLVTDILVGIGWYQQAVWRGVCDAAAELGIKTITYVGGPLSPTPVNPFEKTKNVAFEFIMPEILDGIVYCGGTLGTGATVEVNNAFFKRFSSIPAVSVGPFGDQVPRVLVDNEQGMKEIVLHLIEEHGYRKIAFISGPAGNDEANRRKKSYLDAMRESDIPVDQNLVYEGNFNDHSGVDAVAYWFDTLGLKPEAIVASNDNMAYGVLSALQERGISVPYSVAVTGFDDAADAAMTLPPLSTVRQPIYAQGKRALLMLVDAIAGAPLPHETLEPPVQVYRQSCGCLSRSVVSFEQALSGATDSIERDVFNLVGIKSGEESAENLSHLVQEITKEDCNEQESLRLLAELLRKDVLSGRDIGRWYNAINRIRFADTGRSTLLHQSQAMIGDAIQQQIYMNMIKERKQIDLLISAQQELITSFKMDTLVEVMRDSFYRLGMKGVVLCIYDDPLNAAKSAHIATAFKNGKNVPFPERSFPTSEIVPSEVDYLSKDGASIILQPLYYRDEQLGYLVFEQTVSAGMLYESLATEVSSALKGALLIDRIMDAEKNLEERNRKIEALVRPMMDSIQSVTKVTAEQHETIAELEELNQQSIRAAGEMSSNTKELAETLKKTGELVTGIDDITEVINVVAINASIQAAHVGKQGAGFAVIAGEVRKLAQATRKNSNEINGFLKNVDGKILGLTTANTDLSESFAQLRNTVKNTVQSLENISDKMGEMGRGSNEILQIMNEK
ncbi:MAG TPA: substrate-binding domain-containing protein [Treponema sp.]|nr:substrate-binding domain-containing protein [Treponema sp.]